MNAVLVKQKAVELAFAARVVIEQLSRKDSTPEGMKAAEIVEAAINTVFAHERTDDHHQKAA